MLNLIEDIKIIWDRVQDLLDIQGDVVMLAFTSAVIYKILHGGLNAFDSAAFASAIGCFAYSNTNKPKGA